MEQDNLQTNDTMKWKELPIKEKIKYCISIGLVSASIILGFISFFILFEIPGSVLGLEGIWLATALAVIGIGMYFHNSLVQFETKVNKRLEELNKDE